MDQEKNCVSRREFLSAAAVAATVMAAGPMFKVSAKSETKMAMPDIYVCGVCGHVEFGAAPENCPICHAPKEKFTEKNTLFADAMKKFPEVSPEPRPGHFNQEGIRPGPGNSLQRGKRPGGEAHAPHGRGAPYQVHRFLH